jgi:hypothetical protein
VTSHTSRQIKLKARSRLKNESDLVAGHPTHILAVEKVESPFPKAV